MSCLSVDHIGEPYKTAEQIEMPFGVWTLVGLRTTLHGGLHPPYGKGNFGESIRGHARSRYTLQGDMASGYQYSSNLL